MIQGLLPDKSYLFRVSPCNAVGTGPWAPCTTVFRTAGTPRAAQKVRAYRNGIRFEMQDLLRDAPVLGCEVEYRNAKDKQRVVRFAFRDYKAEKTDQGVFTTWELRGMAPGRGGGRRWWIEHEVGDEGSLSLVAVIGRNFVQKSSEDFSGSFVQLRRNKMVRVLVCVPLRSASFSSSQAFTPCRSVRSTAPGGARFSRPTWRSRRDPDAARWSGKTIG